MIRFEHDAKMDVADFIETKMNGKFSIKDVEKEKIVVEVK